MLIDSHCHLDMMDPTPFGGDIDGIIDAATAAGVGAILNISVDMESFPQVLATARRYPHVHATVGVHPNHDSGRDPSVEELVAAAADPKVIAIGETGLDYFRLSGDPAPQQARFRRHIAAAIAINKPLVIHCREARADTLRLLQEEGAARVGGIMHCFVEDWATAEAAMAMGFFISFSGIVTFKSAVDLQQVAQQVPLDRLLIETDSPFLAPVPHRGKGNQPAFVGHVAAMIAQLRGCHVDEVIAASSANYQRLFGINCAA